MDSTQSSNVLLICIKQNNNKAIFCRRVTAGIADQLFSTLLHLQERPQGKLPYKKSRGTLGAENVVLVPHRIFGRKRSTMWAIAVPFKLSSKKWQEIMCCFTIGTSGVEEHLQPSPQSRIVVPFMGSFKNFSRPLPSFLYGIPFPPPLYVPSLLLSRATLICLGLHDLHFLS